MLDKLASLIGIGRVSLVDDDGDVQELQITEGATGQGFADRVIDKVRRVSEFGFASVPPIDSEALMLRRMGSRWLSIIIGTSHRPSRPRGLKPGDAGIYDVRGAKVMLTAEGLSIDCAGLPVHLKNATTVTIAASDTVRIEAPRIVCTGDVVAKVDGEAISLTALHDAYNSHCHAKVMAGAALTDPPTPTA